MSLSRQPILENAMFKAYTQSGLLIPYDQWVALPENQAPIPNTQEIMLNIPAAALRADSVQNDHKYLRALAIADYPEDATNICISLARRNPQHTPAQVATTFLSGTGYLADAPASSSWIAFHATLEHNHVYNVHSSFLFTGSDVFRKDDDTLRKIAKDLSTRAAYIYPFRMVKACAGETNSARMVEAVRDFGMYFTIKASPNVNVPNLDVSLVKTLPAYKEWLMRGDPTTELFAALKALQATGVKR